MNNKKLLDSFLDALLKEEQKKLKIKIDSSHISREYFNRVFYSKLTNYIKGFLLDTYKQKFGIEKIDNFKYSESLISDAFEVFMTLLERDIIFTSQLNSYSEEKNEQKRELLRFSIVNKFIRALKNFIIDKIFEPIEQSLYRKVKKAIENNSLIEDSASCIKKDPGLSCFRRDDDISIEKWVKENDFKVVYDRNYEYMDRAPVLIHQKDVDSLLAYVISEKGAINFYNFLNILKELVNYNLHSFTEETFDFEEAEYSSMEEKIYKALMSSLKEKGKSEFEDYDLANNMARLLVGFVLKEKEAVVVYLNLFLSQKIEDECRGVKLRGEKLAEFYGMAKSTFFDTYNRALRKIKEQTEKLSVFEVADILQLFSRKILDLYGNTIYEVEKKIKEALQC